MRLSCSLHGAPLAAQRTARGAGTAAMLLCLMAACWAQAPAEARAGAAAERQRIEAERRDIEARYATELARCNERFVVTACADKARQRRRAALAVPRARELALDDAERRARAAARRQEVLDKQRHAASAGVAPRFELAIAAAAAAASASAAEAAAAPALPASATEPALPASAAVDVAKSASAPASAGAGRHKSDAGAAAAERRAQAAAQRRQKILAEQARIAAREAERARAGKSAAPLPTPAASSAAP